MLNDIERVLISEEELQAKVREMGPVDRSKIGAPRSCSICLMVCESAGWET